jgi:hypothetical protein
LSGYLAEQGLSRPEIDDNHKWAHFALPGLGFTAAAGLFWKLTTYAQHYQQTLETLPPENEVEDTASEVVFLNEDISVGPAGGLRSRTKTGEEVTFSPDLGLVASPLRKGRGRKKEEGEVVEQEKKVVEVRRGLLCWLKCSCHGSFGVYMYSFDCSKVRGREEEEIEEERKVEKLQCRVEGEAGRGIGCPGGKKTVVVKGG